MRPALMKAVIGSVMVACVVAGMGLASLTADRKSGECKLQEAGPFDEGKAVKLKLGKTLKGECSWHIGEFFDKNVIFAGVTIENPTDKAMFFNYYVAFFDKDKKLIGCAEQGSFGDEGLAAKKETQLGSCLIHLPEDAIKQITSYQVVLYESDKPIGARAKADKPATDE